MTTSDWLGLGGKTALVTGGGNGIGLAIARAFLDIGARVIILDRDPATPEVARRLAARGDRCTRSFVVDVRDRPALREVRAALERDGCPLDIIVPNAGINIRKPLLDLEAEEVDEIIDTNLTGVIATLQTFAPMMIGQPEARIVVNSSVIAVHGMVLRATYAASKAALSGLVRSLAMEWGPQGVTVNAVGPGVIRTTLTEAYIAAHPDRAEAAVRNTALGRIGTPEEVADAVLFLASRAARFVTGQTLYVDGGALGREQLVVAGAGRSAAEEMGVAEQDSIATFPVGKEVTYTKIVSESDVNLFAEITGDKDPIHIDEAYAKTTPYGQRIAHGALIIGYMSTASTLIHEGFGRPLVSLGYDRVRLIGPVFIGDTVTVTYRVVDKDLARSRTIAEVTVTNQRGETVVVANHLQKVL